MKVAEALLAAQAFKPKGVDYASLGPAFIDNVNFLALNGPNLTNANYPDLWDFDGETGANWDNAGIMDSAGSFRKAGITVSGSKGDTVLSASFNTAQYSNIKTDAVPSDAVYGYGAIIEHSDGTLGLYTVQSVNGGGNTVTIRPALEKPTQNGSLSPAFHLPSSQHLSVQGCWHWADRIFEANPLFSNLSGVFNRFSDYQASNDGGWSISGNASGPWFQMVANVPETSAGTYNRPVISRHTQYFTVNTTATDGKLTRTISGLTGKTGYFEFYIGADYNCPRGWTLEAYGDKGFGTENKIMTIYQGYGLQRVCIPFGGFSTLTVVISIKSATVGGIRFGAATVYCPQNVDPFLFKPGELVIYYTHSWGHYKGGAIARRLNNRLQSIGGRCIGAGAGGMTTAYAYQTRMANIINKKPAAVVIQFDVNDFNNINDGYQNADGSGPAAMTISETIANLKSLVSECQNNGIKPIIVNYSCNGFSDIQNMLGKWKTVLDDVVANPTQWGYPS